MFLNVAAPRRTSSPIEDSVDPREIDQVLVEVAGMAGRWNIFKKYVTENLTVGFSQKQHHCYST